MTEPKCSGLCVTAREVGIEQPGIAYPHPNCDLHSQPSIDPKEWIARARDAEHYMDLACRVLPRALDALEAVLSRVEDFEANGNAAELGDPSAHTWHKAADILRRDISMKLRGAR